jgi:hypothetical protein
MAGMPPKATSITIRKCKSQYLININGYRIEFSLKLWIPYYYRTVALVVLRHRTATPYEISGTCGPALGIPELVTRNYF